MELRGRLKLFRRADSKFELELNNPLETVEPEIVGFPPIPKLDGNALKPAVNVVKRDSYGRVLPGSVLNPNGHKAYHRDFLAEFSKTLERIEKKKHEKFLARVIRRAYLKDPVMLEVFDRIIPKNRGSGEAPPPTVINVVNLYR